MKNSKKGGPAGAAAASVTSVQVVVALLEMDGVLLVVVGLESSVRCCYCFSTFILKQVARFKL